MTGISTAFANMHTRIAALLTSHVRLSDPYNLDQNTPVLLKLGYGLTFGPGSSVDREILTVGGKRTQVKTFGISLTRQFYAKEFDAAAKDVATLALHEDLAILINDFILEDTLNAGAIITGWLDDSGIIEVFSDKNNFLAIQANFTVEIRDTIT